MRSSTTKKNAEARILTAIALTCCATVLCALLAVSYTVFSLATSGLDENIFAAYSRQMF